MASEHALTFQSAGRRLFGFLHLPEKSRAGVVFCHPFGDEKKCSHRVMVEAARALDADGVAVLRFDMTGCGDSEGGFRDATVVRWREDLAAAADLVCNRAGVNALGLLGLRLGASIAALAAADLPKLAFLALWEPIVSGRSAFEADLRRKLIKQMMTDGRSSDSRKELLAKLERGDIEVDLDGYPITGPLYRELCAIDLLGQQQPFTGPLLLMQISFNERVAKPFEKLAEFHRNAGAEVTVTPVVAPPLWNRLELAQGEPLIQATREWLHTVLPSA